MDDFEALSADEKKVITAFRNGDRLVRARIFVAATDDAIDPLRDDVKLLEYMATYMDCSDYGRARCLEASEIFASASSVEEARSTLAKLDESRLRCAVIDITTARLE